MRPGQKYQLFVKKPNSQAEYFNAMQQIPPFFLFSVTFPIY